MLAPVRIEQQPDRPASPLFAGKDVRLAAVRGRDTAAHGHFYYSVPTTGVYCNPSCAARPALRQNMAFHETRDEAEQAGFRACKRCRPELALRATREADVVAAACRLIKQAAEAPSLSSLAIQLGSPPAVRAVAGACAANTLAVAVPCHRVVASDGGLAGYRWGVERKSELLKRERA